jgi:hypothetical protein
MPRVLLLFGLFTVAWSNSAVAPQIYGPYNYAASLVAFALFYRLRDTPIRSRILHFLGDISYPLYVVHPLVGYGGLALALKAGLSPAAALALVVPTVFVLAYLLHRVVEKPSIRLGHAVARSESGRASMPGAALPQSPFGLAQYAKRIWAARYFWIHLVERICAQVPPIVARPALVGHPPAGAHRLAVARDEPRVRLFDRGIRTVRIFRADLLGIPVGRGADRLATPSSTPRATSASFRSRC